MNHPDHDDVLSKGWTFWYSSGSTSYYRRGDRVLHLDGDSMGVVSLWAHVA